MIFRLAGGGPNSFLMNWSRQTLELCASRQTTSVAPGSFLRQEHLPNMSKDARAVCSLEGWALQTSQDPYRNSRIACLLLQISKCSFSTSTVCSTRLLRKRASN